MPEFRLFAMKNCISLICLFYACACWRPALARAGRRVALVNSEVEVDVTGKDAADAREQAMAKGEIDALIDLLNKLTTPEQAAHIINDLDPSKITSMVRGTEVADEKISSNRYRARLTVTFDGDQISGLIGKGMPARTGAADRAVGSFLVIPGYEEDGNAMLWEDTNPWRAVWKSTGLEVNSGDIVVPFGDNQDIAVIDTRNLTSATYGTLAPLSIRYGVSDIVILQAKFTRAPEMSLSVVKRRINRVVNEVNLLTYRADPQETKDALLARAARDIADNLQHKKNEEMETSKAVHGGDRNTLMLLANVSTLSSWTQLRAKLGALPMIDKLELLAISPQQVDMIVHYRGTPESLANAITASNLRLVKNDNYWVVSRD